MGETDTRTNGKRQLSPDFENATPEKGFKKSKSEVCASKPPTEQGNPATDLPAAAGGSDVEDDSTACTDATVGIQEFADDTVSGFFGIIKQRYEDFLVNEIDMQGNVIHITELGLPSEKAIGTAEAVPEDEAVAAEKKAREREKSLSELGALLDEETVASVKEILETAGKEKKSVLCKPEEDKAKRTAVHIFFRNQFENQLATETADGCVLIEWAGKGTSNGRCGKKHRRRKEDPFEALGGEFCRFNLYKENKDTMDALNLLARTMKVNPKIFSYAGTKDRRGITVQQVTAHRVRAERLSAMNRRNDGIRMGNFTYVKQALRLGDLSGNRFTIVLRELQVDSEDTIRRAIESIQTRGFFNYFGMQRFGTSSVPTHEIGRMVLKGEWELAVDLILRPRKGDRADFDTARRHWREHRDPKEALRLLPSRCMAERAVLQSLSRSSKDYLGAFNSIPRNLRSIYLHAYQSYIWNHMVSERVRRYGFDKPVVGDIVMVNAGRRFRNPVDSPYPVEESAEEVRILESEEECDRFSIFDVVLPLPGVKVVYPKNEIADKYKELMATDGLDPEDMSRKVKEYSLAGGYRLAFAKAKNVTWKLLRYDDNVTALANTDMGVKNGAADAEGVVDGKHLALRIGFDLDSSQYATMVLRELMKSKDTTAAHQASICTVTVPKCDGAADLDGGDNSANVS